MGTWKRPMPFDVVTKLSLPILALVQSGMSRSQIHAHIPLLEGKAVQTPQDLVEALRSPADSIDAFGSAWSNSLRTVERCEKLGVSILSLFDSNFPNRLRSIKDSPVLLFARGDVSALRAPISAAVIGTREPTAYGQGAAYKIARYLAECGLAVVSGLARGCDTQAHRGCIDGFGQTVAVLAHGLDTVYPPENAGLAFRIVESGGCLLSEYAPGVRPGGFAFVERDRLQSGLSDATIVIETGVKGGTLHTANFCLQQGRILAVMAHPPKLQNAEKAQGNKMLIQKRGALAIANREELETKVLSFMLSCRAGKEDPADWKPNKQLSVLLKCAP